MKYSPKDIILGLLKTIVLLILLEICSSAVFPAIGLDNLKPAFNVLIILFLAFKLDDPSLPFLILALQYVHSIFSIEGWAIGTLTGVIISLSLKYLRELLNFSSAISTIVVVQIFQLGWFFIVAIMLSIKLGNFGQFFNLFWQFVPESFALSIISPLFFKLLDNFWKVDRRMSGVNI